MCGGRSCISHGRLYTSERRGKPIERWGRKARARRHVVPGQPVAELRKARPDACRSAIRLQDESDFCCGCMKGPNLTEDQGRSGAPGQLTTKLIASTVDP